MKKYFEHKPLKCPNCQSNNILKVVSKFADNLSLGYVAEKELLRKKEAVVYDGEGYHDIPNWKCIACCSYFHKVESPPIRYIFEHKPLECPVCHSEKIAEILYGEPCYSKKLRRQEQNGEVVIGGCLVDDDFPSWRCYNCEQDLHKKGGLYSEGY